MSRRQQVEFDDDEYDDNEGKDELVDDDEAVAGVVLVPPDVPEVVETKPKKVWRGTKEWFLKPFVQVCHYPHHLLTSIIVILTPVCVWCMCFVCYQRVLLVVLVCFSFDLLCR
jgi:hypothetical protein